MADLTGQARLFADYWQRLPKRDGIADRKDFDVSQLRGIIQSLVILQLESPEVVRFRLAGTEEVRRYGYEVTGGNYLDFVPEWRRPAVVQCFRLMLNWPCGMRVVVRSQTRGGIALHNQAVGFPFRGRDGRVDQLIFQSTDLDRTLTDNASNLIEVHEGVVERDFLDLGHGLPPEPQQPGDIAAWQASDATRQRRALGRVSDAEAGRRLQSFLVDSPMAK